MPGPYRSGMKRCYHRECDSKRNGHKGEFANYDFLVHTIQTVVDAVSEMAGAECPLSKRWVIIPVKKLWNLSWSCIKDHKMQWKLFLCSGKKNWKMPTKRSRVISIKTVAKILLLLRLVQETNTHIRTYFITFPIIGYRPISVTTYWGRTLLLK